MIVAFSVKLECFAELPRLLNEVDGFDLLLKEDFEVLLLFAGVLKELIETSSVLLTSHEGGRQVLHENLSKLTIARFNHFVNDIVVLVKVGSDKLELLLPLLKSVDFVSKFVEGVSGGQVRDLIPQLFFECGIGQRVITDLAYVACAVTSIILEALGAKGLLLLSSEVRAGKVSLDDFILVVGSQFAAEFFVINYNLALVDPLSGHLQVLLLSDK